MGPTRTAHTKFYTKRLSIYLTILECYVIKIAYFQMSDKSNLGVKKVPSMLSIQPAEDVPYSPGYKR